MKTINYLGAEDVANARLIAAAPDLLEALTSLIEAFDADALEMNSPEIDGEPSGGYGVGQATIPPHPWHEEWLSHARAAIARVTEATP